MGYHEKKCALVTGGTRGIGAAIVNKFLDHGIDKIYVTGTKDNYKIHDKRIEYLKVNFLEANSTALFLEKVKHLKIDILVNNAGINKIGSVENYDSTYFNNILTVNLSVPFEICKAVLPGMKEQKWGRIVHISSIFGKISKEFRAPYSASKFGLDGLSAAISAEYAMFNILSNCVSPGFIDTELTRSVLTEEEINKLQVQVPMKRLGTADEVAEFVSWLASSKNTFITGQNLAIDGGFTRV